ncbi:DUF167 domain-containing protein [Candidatus Bathyarchaeota archaeon]|jgi:uncharacterized protein (TIGR00251 family)|nr:DUF167 domain-containing protein [Candidatus Bathyarchaeota archaeon]
MRYNVEVQFRKDNIIIDQNKIIIGIRSPPVKGKANLELIKKLARHFDIPSSQIQIISGFKSKRKIVDIQK